MNFLFGMQGRITRLQWWLGGLVPPVIWLVAFVVIGESVGEDLASTAPGRQLLAYAALLGAVALSFWINFCLAAKRLHDRGKSAWWFLISFVPLVGTIWFIVELGLLAGDYGTNEYGPEPGATSASDLQAELLATYAPDNSMPHPVNAAGPALGAGLQQAARHATPSGASRPRPAFGQRRT